MTEKRGPLDRPHGIRFCQRIEDQITLDTVDAQLRNCGRLPSKQTSTTTPDEDRADKIARSQLAAIGQRAAERETDG
jgi:hypothetical protein